MKTYEELALLNTDDERFNALSEIGYMHFDIVQQWSEEAKTPEMKKIFHDRAVRLYHEEEYRTFGEI